MSPKLAWMTVRSRLAFAACISRSNPARDVSVEARQQAPIPIERDGDRRMPIRACIVFGCAPPAIASATRAVSVGTERSNKKSP